MYSSGNGDADNTESEFAGPENVGQMSGLEKKAGPVFVGPNVGAGKCRTGNCGTGK